MFARQGWARRKGLEKAEMLQSAVPKGNVFGWSFP
jgi:hypothetical protein